MNVGIVYESCGVYYCQVSTSLYLLCKVKGVSIC